MTFKICDLYLSMALYFYLVKFLHRVFVQSTSSLVSQVIVPDSDKTKTKPVIEK